MFSPPQPALNVSDKAFPEYNAASNWVYLFGFKTPGLVLWKASYTQSVCERKLIKPIEATSCYLHLWDLALVTVAMTHLLASGLSAVLQTNSAQLGWFHRDSPFLS